MNSKLICCGLMAISFSMAHAQNFPKIEASYGSGTQEFSLATGSPGELGLLKLLGEEFGKKENAKMNWVKAGSGASLNLLKNKQVDMIMVHAPSAVNKAISEGWAALMSFILFDQNPIQRKSDLQSVVLMLIKKFLKLKPILFPVVINLVHMLKKLIYGDLLAWFQVGLGTLSLMTL